MRCSLAHCAAQIDLLPQQQQPEQQQPEQQDQQQQQQPLLAMAMAMTVQ